MIEPKITSSYEHKLQAIYCDINNRGIMVDTARVKEAKEHVKNQIKKELEIASQQWGITLYMGADNNPNLGLKPDNVNYKEAFNINSTSGDKSLLNLLKKLKYEIPKITKRNEEGEYESKYSTGELTLQRMLRDNQFNFPSGDPALKAVLAIRELGKLNSSYLNARLARDQQGQFLYLTNYNVAGTLTGRRASRKHTYGYGNNAQNFPKHGITSKLYRRCLVARPGNIFLAVDQKSAEEWPVSALAENLEAITEMINGVNRHIKRAVYIFNIPFEKRTEKEWKDSVEYYLGKKTGHANNYGMGYIRMADSLIQEGNYVSPESCKVMLKRLNELEPQIKGVFHHYIQTEINRCRILKTPFGRERQFLGLRPNDANTKIFNEGYSWIPQSTVGDNTGFAVAHIENETSIPLKNRFIVQEGHDSIVQDIPDNLDVMWQALSTVIDGFRRTIVFHNGIAVEIPIEAEIGFDFRTTVKVEDLSYDGLKHARQALAEKILKMAS